MGPLRNLTVSQQIGLLFVVLFGLLTIVTIVAFSRTLRDRSDVQLASHEQFKRELRVLLSICAKFDPVWRTKFSWINEHERYDGAIAPGNCFCAALSKVNIALHPLRV